MVNAFLKIGIQGQIYVVPGGCIGFILCFTDSSYTVLVNSLFPFCALKLMLHGIFDSCTSYDVINIIIIFLFLQALQLILRDLTGIADDRCKGNAVIVCPDGGFLHIHSLHLPDVLQNIRYGFIRNLAGHCSRFIFAVRHEAKSIFYVDDVQGLLVCQINGISIRILHI